jgi:hypothetical protein
LLVLPSIIQNSLIPNKHHRCDIFVHFYVVKSEKLGRSGSGGTIDPMAVFKLQDAVRELYSDDDDDDAGDDDSVSNTNMNISIPRVSFTNDTDADFDRKRGMQIEKYHNTKDPDGNYVYFPWKLKTYTYPSTMDNIS